MKPIRAWAVVDEVGIVGYQDYNTMPNNVLLRICEHRKQAKQIKVYSAKVIQVEIRPIKQSRKKGKRCAS